MTVATFAVPAELDAQRRLGPSWGTWLDGLAGRYAQIVEEWQLVPDGATLHGYCSVVVPVRTVGGLPAALKLTFDGDDESLHESLALQHWHGNGAVRLFRADPHRRALLLERLHPEDLTPLWDLEACAVVAALYPRLHLPAPAQLRTVTSYVERWLEALAGMPRDAPIPRRYVEQALSLGRNLVADPASVGKLIHGDLHYENVLAADREPWLAIDPKPMSGDPHYECAPMLWNRWDEVVDSGDVRRAVRARFHTLVDGAGLDEARARDWVVVRMVLNAHWAIQDDGLGRPDLDWVTRCLAVVKAVQD